MDISGDMPRYQAFVTQLARALGTLAVDAETVLWHYTTGNGLLGILNSNSVYATQVSCLNDSTEVLYASRLFRDALSKEKEKHPTESPQRKFIEEAVRFFQEDIEIPNHVRLPYFVTCFSEARDDLSQWRAYGGGENGYALAFKAKDIRGIPNSVLARVIYYNPQIHAGLAETVAAQTVEFFSEGLSKYPDEKDNWTGTFLSTWDQLITQVAPMIKDPGFDGEREYRLIKSYMLEDLKDMKFLQKGAMLSRHLPIKPSPTGTDPYQLPIQEVMIGPCRYPNVSRISVGTLLQQKGYICPVTISRSPYQAT